MDRLHSMRVFARVIDAGSFAGAAREMNLSPAIVTRLVADLEEHLGARLINRTTRRLALTDTGEAYLERVRRVLTEVEEAESLASAATTEPRGQLRVLVPPAFAVHQMAKHLPAFFAQYPRVAIELSAPGAVHSVDENYDVSILNVSQPLADGDFVARRLARSEVIMCASPEYLDRRGRPAHPLDLPPHDVMVPNWVRDVTFHEGVAALTRPRADAGAGASAGESAGESAGDSVTMTPRHGPLSTAHLDTLYAAVLAGMGITGLPSFMVEDALLENALERVLPRWRLLSTTIYAAMPTRKYVPARTRVFVDFLVQTFGGGEHDPWLLSAGCETAPTPRRSG